MFSFESLIKASFEHMAITPFQNENLVRELKILKNIAIQHGLLDLFEHLLRNTKRKLPKNTGIRGLLITHSMRLDGSKYGINNIYDASLAIKFIFNFSRKLNISIIKELIVNTIKLYFGSKSKEVMKYPDID